MFNMYEELNFVQGDCDVGDAVEKKKQQQQPADKIWCHIVIMAG